MINCENCQSINNMSKECKENKPQYFDKEANEVRPKGDCHKYFPKVHEDE